MKLNGGEIQEGTRKHLSDASFPGTWASSSMPEWYPELLASVTLQVNVGRFKVVSAAHRKSFTQGCPDPAIFQQVVAPC